MYVNYIIHHRDYCDIDIDIVGLHEDQGPTSGFYIIKWRIQILHEAQHL